MIKVGKMAAKSQEIQQFMIDHVEEHPRDIVRLTADHFGITRQAVNRHVRILIDDGAIEATGKTSERTYCLAKQEHSFSLPLAENNAEDLVYQKYIDPLLSTLKKNVQDIIYYGFTEMFNNVIDHSGGTKAMLYVRLTVKKCSLMIVDDGVGVFERIKSRLDLHDHRVALLELSKGKLTTDATRHSGQGIFFTSRMFDEFSLSANSLAFIHRKDQDDWMIEVKVTAISGTVVLMEIATDSLTTTKDVFDRYTDLASDDYAFSKTHVPLSLARYKDEDLISRSQAKRVLSRFDRFREVLLDFKGVTSIGQAFADEIFRVYKQSHPEVVILAINTTAQVDKMISRAKSVANAPDLPNGTAHKD
jgi:anti-sigma regulatory factor (Ser/Thr protein kinase)